MSIAPQDDPTIIPLTPEARRKVSVEAYSGEDMSTGAFLVALAITIAAIPVISVFGGPLAGALFAGFSPIVVLGLTFAFDFVGKGAWSAIKSVLRSLGWDPLPAYHEVPHLAAIPPTYAEDAAVAPPAYEAPKNPVPAIQSEESSYPEEAPPPYEGRNTRHSV